MSKDAASAHEAIPFDPANRKLGIVVGFDGSENSIQALIYGARIAQRRGSPLSVVTSVTIPAQVYTTLAAIPRTAGHELEDQAIQESLDQARSVLQDYPGEVSYIGETGDAAGVLVDKSEQAELVVVGARGRGGFLGLLLGSVASAVPAHAKSPTVIVPRKYRVGDQKGAALFAPTEDTAPVVVGTDNSTHSRIAVLQAAQEAEARGVELELVTVLPSLDEAILWYTDDRRLLTETAAAREAELKQTLEAERDWVKGYFPNLKISLSVETGEPIKVLRQKSGTAQLTVAGTRGRGEFSSLVLGSVSRGVLVRAEGPVMVVPQLTDNRL